MSAPKFPCPAWLIHAETGLFQNGDLARVTVQRVTVTAIAGKTAFYELRYPPPYRPTDLKPDQEQLSAFYGSGGTDDSPVFRRITNQYAPATARYTGLKVQNANGNSRREQPKGSIRDLLIPPPTPPSNQKHTNQTESQNNR